MATSQDLIVGQHPLDGCDPEDCYRVMMAERTTLINARREAEDNLIKTIIQLSTALIAVVAGFVTQSKITLSENGALVLSLIMLSLGLCIVIGLAEHLFSSKAYADQQAMVEKYYSKEISSFSEPRANRFVRWAQLGTFLFFVLAMIGLGALGVVKSWEKTNAQPNTSAAASSSPTATATASAASSSPTATAAAAAAANKASRGTR